MGHGNEFFLFVRQEPGINRVGNDPAGFVTFLTDDVFHTGHFDLFQEPPRRIGQRQSRRTSERPISCWRKAFIDSR